MSDDVQLVHCVLDFAAANRERGISQEILSLYCDHLRAQCNIDHLRALLAFPVADEPTAQAQHEGTTLTLEEGSQHFFPPKSPLRIHQGDFL